MSETEQTLTCAFHPKRETQLRCNRCDKPICIRCATHTPTGYRCPECIRSQQKVFVTTKWFDPLIAGLVSGAIAYFGSLIADFIPWFYLEFLLALGTGYVAVLATKKAISNRRSPLLKYVMGGAAFLASLAPALYQLMRFYLPLGYGLIGGLFAIIWDLAFSVIITAYIYYQLRN